MDKSQDPNDRPSEAHEEDKEVEHIAARLKQFDAVQWADAVAHKRAMPAYNPNVAEEFEALSRLLKSDRLGAFIDADGKSIDVYPSDNPDPDGSFGYVGAFIVFKTEREDSPGTLAVRFDPEKLGAVARETLHLCWWDEETRHFVPVPDSRVGVHGDYVWGSVKGAGIYALIGINAHPVLYPVIRHLCSAMHMLPQLSIEARRGIIDPICTVILCAPDLLTQLEGQPELMDEMLLDAARRGLPLPDLSTRYRPERGWGRLGGVGNPCDVCLGLTSDPYLPECVIIDMTDVVTWPPLCRGNWESVGPANLSGCIRHVVVDPTSSLRLYCAAANGGVWVLHDVSSYPRVTWRPLTDQLERLAMDIVEAATSDSRVLYAASNGYALFRSDDRGANWTRLTATNGWFARRLLIHPADSMTVYAATNSGFFISTDGGLTWTLQRSGDIRDAELDPLDSSIVYIGVLGEGVLKSVTSGYGPWRNVLPWSTAPVGTPGEIKIALGVRHASGVVQTNVDRTVVVKFGLEIYVSSAGGTGTWTARGQRGMTSQLWWDNVLAVDPYNPQIILSGEQELYRTADGGITWTRVASYYEPHEDQQSLAFDRNNRGVVYLANDGGVYRSTGSGATWYAGPIDVDAEILARRSLVSGLVTAEFYSAGVQGTNAVANLYHSGIIASDGLSSSRWHGIEGHAWEFNNVVEDPKRLGRYYVLAGELIRRRYPGTGTDDLISFGQFQPIKRYSSLAVDLRPTSNIILVCAAPAAGTSDSRLMMTTEGNREPSVSGGVVTNRPAWTSVLTTGTDALMSVAFARSQPQRAYAMTDSGRVFRKDNIDATGAWTEVGRWITSGVREMAVSGSNANTVFAITASRFARSQDGGVRWTEFGTGVLPTSEFNSLVTHPTSVSVVYLSMDVGVFVSYDDGQTWTAFDSGLPNAELVQLAIDGNYLYATTYGRGLWRRRIC